MAVLAAAQLLDELMGRNRNIAPNEKKKELNWEDQEFCPFYLVKFCPHDLFVNTRADLGACAKVHDEEAKKLFQQAKAYKKIHYQEEFIRFCSQMVNEVERKIQKGKTRLALSTKNETPPVPQTQAQKNQEQIDILNERINNLELEAEQAGTDGNVEQAQGLMKLCDQLKEERDALKKQMESGHWSVEFAAAQEKQMEVCEVCGAFLIVGDAQQRIDDHLSGKQHVGFSKLKTAVEEIQEVIKATREERRKSEDKHRERERDREKRKERVDEKSRVDKKRGRESRGEKEKDKWEKERDRSERRDHKDRERKHHRTDREHERERTKHHHHHHHKHHRH